MSELTQKLQLPRTLWEKESLQDDLVAVLSANCTQVGCSEALMKCRMDAGSMDGFAWRRLAPRSFSSILLDTSGRPNATATAQGSGSKAHKLAVLVPYRDRPAQLDAMLPTLNAFLQVHGFAASHWSSSRHASSFQTTR